MKYFWNPPKGLNAKIELHRVEQKKLEDKIADLETQEQTEMVKRSLATYRNFLCQLLQSKAEAVSNIGKKNNI